MVAKITREIGANEIASENRKLRAFVQANVQDRDLGGFVAEVEQKLKTIAWDGMTHQMTGEYENQHRFVKTMTLVFPIVLLIIFVLLYIVYHSALEAAHVMLAVPFALSGGVFLQYLLGYCEEASCRTRRGLRLHRARPSREGRRTPPPAAESDDRRHHRRQPDADHVEPPSRRGSHETPSHAGDRRYDFQPDPHPDRDTGDISMAPGP